MQPSDRKAPARWSAARIARGVGVRVLVFGALLLLVRVTSLGESFAVYFPSREPFVTPHGIEDVLIPTPDGRTLHAWFVPARGASPGEVRPAVLHVHGNAGRVPDHLPFSDYLTRAGMHVLILSYRGYGRSSPERLLTRRELLIDTLAAFDALEARPDVDPQALGMYGVSLGGSFALAAAKQRPSVRAVCTVSAFSSWMGIAQDHIPLLGPVLMPRGLDAVESVRGLGERPLLIVHGDTDSVVPVRHAHVLDRAARDASVPTTLAIITGGDHNAIIADHPDAARAITAFFRGTLGIGSAEAPSR